MNCSLFVCVCVCGFALCRWPLWVGCHVEHAILYVVPCTLPVARLTRWKLMLANNNTNNKKPNAPAHLVRSWFSGRKWVQPKVLELVCRMPYWRCGKTCYCHVFTYVCTNCVTAAHLYVVTYSSALCVCVCVNVPQRISVSRLYYNVAARLAVWRRKPILACLPGRPNSIASLQNPDYHTKQPNQLCWKILSPRIYSKQIYNS